MWFSSFFFSTFCRFPSLSNSSALSLASRLFLFSFHYSKYVGKCERKWKEKYFKATLSTFHFIFMKNYFYFTFTHSPIHTINLFSVFIVFNTSHHHRRPTPCHPQVHVFLFWHQSTNGCYAERTLFDERKSVFLFSGNSWWEIYFEITIIFHIYHIHRFSLSIYIFRSISALSVIASRGVAAADIVGAVIIKSTFAIQCVYVRKMRRSEDEGEALKWLTESEAQSGGRMERKKWRSRPKTMIKVRNYCTVYLLQRTCECVCFVFIPRFWYVGRGMKKNETVSMRWPWNSAVQNSHHIHSFRGGALSMRFLTLWVWSRRHIAAFRPGCVWGSSLSRFRYSNARDNLCV